MKIQGVSGNLFFKYRLREVFEAGIFGEDMTEKPGKCEADNKKKQTKLTIETASGIKNIIYKKE